MKRKHFDIFLFFIRMRLLSLYFLVFFSLEITSDSSYQNRLLNHRRVHVARRLAATRAFLFPDYRVQISIKLLTDLKRSYDPRKRLKRLKLIRKLVCNPWLWVYITYENKKKIPFFWAPILKFLIWKNWSMVDFSQC